VGTLFSQPERQPGLINTFEWVKDFARNIAKDRNSPTLAEYHAACDILRTALAVQSADVLDEQLGGFGRIAESLVEAVNQISNRVEDGLNVSINAEE
jgi:hypothetical protein